METEIKVLDHGYVRYINHMGGEEDIIRAARMSTQKGFLGWDKFVCMTCKAEQAAHPDFMKSYKQNPDIWHLPCEYCKGKTELVKGDEKLLEYLYKNKHMTPFEMLELCLQIKLPIFVVREVHRHRTFSYNEMSARYIQMPNEHYVPEVRMQDTKNKQGSLSADEVAFASNQDFKNNVRLEQDRIYAQYEVDLRAGIAKEVARINTPVGRYTVMWMKGNLRNWLQFLQLRMAPNAQWEIRQYANAVASIIRELWPRTYELFEEYTLNSYMLFRSEIATLVLAHSTANTDAKFADLNNLNDLLTKLERK